MIEELYKFIEKHDILREAELIKLLNALYDSDSYETTYVKDDGDVINVYGKSKKSNNLDKQTSHLRIHIKPDGGICIESKRINAYQPKNSQKIKIIFKNELFEYDQNLCMYNWATAQSEENIDSNSYERAIGEIDIYGDIMTYERSKDDIFLETADSSTLNCCFNSFTKCQVTRVARNPEFPNIIQKVSRDVEGNCFVIIEKIDCSKDYINEPFRREAVGKSNDMALAHYNKKGEFTLTTLGKQALESYNLEPKPESLTAYLDMLIIEEKIHSQKQH